MHMREICYILVVFFTWLIIYDYMTHNTPLQEGMTSDKDNILWSENLHNIKYLNTRMDALENLDDIRKNNPEILGEHANDKNIKISDVVSYFKSGVDDNSKSIQMIATKLKNAFPKAKDIHITGV